MTDIFKSLSERGIYCKSEVPLSEMSTFRIGGAADAVAYPESPEELIWAVRAARECGTSFLVIGNGSNVLFSDDGYEGLVISTDRLRSLSFEDESVICCAGVSLPSLSKKAAELGLSGLEFACGIPGYLGGAVCMNAGAHGSEMSDIVLSTRAYDSVRDVVFDIPLKGNLFSYRHSVYSNSPSLICISAELRLKRDSVDAIKARMKEYTEKRRRTQPIEMASAGSFFKRPEGHFAAKLIDDCGLKGLSLGGAQVSLKHAGFIVNTGNATSSDVLKLAEKVKATVMDKFGVCLESEVKYIC
jgi:UDP-N-acetylmuramate dehydrogenase